MSHIINPIRDQANHEWDCLHEPMIKFDYSKFAIGMEEVEVNKCNVIFKSWESVINIDINMSKLKNSP